MLAGLLFVACAVGIRRVLDRGDRVSGGTWAPRLIAVVGASLIAGGVFVPDPAFGFPPGTAPSAPEDLSWHGIVYGIAPAVGLGSLIAASFVFARRFAQLGQREWVVTCGRG
jgi:drug/metabolite transporter (DMT)-like permease